MISVKKILNQAYKILQNHSDSYNIDAEILLCYVLKKSRTWIYTYPEQIIDITQQQTYLDLINLRKNGQPVAYLTGMREFWSLPLTISTNTLIPRPETELLIETILAALKHKTNATILELGTGSGAISLAIASERPNWNIFACDISYKALEVAQNNCEKLKYKNIHFFCSNWMNAIKISKKFDAIISNPPYLANNDIHLQQGDLRFEPINALTSGPSGLEDLEHIIQSGHKYLKNNGVILLEHGYNQEKEVSELLLSNSYKNIVCYKDAQDLPRVSLASL